jgi:hypothetical protein
MRAQPRISVDEAFVAAYEAALARELPRFAVRYKDESRLQRLIGALVRPFNATYLTQYTTVMFGRVYFPSRVWRARRGPAAIYATLRHEAVHLRDARRFPLIFQLTYLFALPAGLTLRAVWEWRAYLETLRVSAEVSGEIPDALLAQVERAFTGPDYLFMCPFPGFVRRRLERARRELLGAAG